MQSLFSTESPVTDIPARSSPPWVWFGFVFSIAFLICEFLPPLLDLDEKAFSLIFAVIMLAAWIYWAVCVHRFHKILEEMTRNRYPIPAGEAAGKHFIPFYNLYWLFAWTSKFAEHLRSRGIQMLPGAVLGSLLLLSVLLRFVDGAVGSALLFGVGLYISAKLKQHMRAVKGTSAELLPPPPPDPSQWRKEPENIPSQT